MSVRVMSAVWESALPHDEKMLALCLADFANDDGGSIFPSQAHMAWKVGKTERAVRAALTKLRERGVLEKVKRPRRGVVTYRLRVDALPTRAPWNNPEESSTLGGSYPEGSSIDPEVSSTNPEDFDAITGSPLPPIRHEPPKEPPSPTNRVGGGSGSSSSMKRKEPHRGGANNRFSYLD